MKKYQTHLWALNVIFIEFTKPLNASWCFEIHSNSWLGNLEIGEAAKVLQKERMATFKILVRTSFFFSNFDPTTDPDHLNLRFLNIHTGEM